MEKTGEDITYVSREVVDVAIKQHGPLRIEEVEATIRFQLGWKRPSQIRPRKKKAQ